MNTVFEQLNKLRFGKRDENVSPHKFAMLLALATLYEDDPFIENKFCITDKLENIFKDCFQKLAPTYDISLATIDLPFYYLKNDGFWFLNIKPGLEDQYYQIENSSNTRFTKKRLIYIVSHAHLSEQFDKYLRDAGNREVFCMELKRLFHAANCSLASGNKKNFERIFMAKARDGNLNPFVGYLNSLQRLNANNDNALAEYQACNPFFSYLHVPHPLAQAILDELKKPGGRHVILTGHAGDGKSTIALEIYKQLANISNEQSLSHPLRPREDLPGAGISIMKDLSERRREEDPALVQELLGNERRFLLVSNTGTLLDLLCGQAAAFGMSKVQIESEILNSIGTERGEAEIALISTRFWVVNLARMDNLEFARQIFARMVAPERWAFCKELSCRVNCPICLNVDLINNRQNIVFDRIFLAYRRMYEYGTRLTVRQITEHLSYIVTSGLEESDIAEMREKHQSPLKAEFMFFNRFFGDNGKEGHPGAQQMRAVSEISKQGFGERPCPIWERKLWLKLRDRYFRLGVEDCNKEFDLLREHGSGPGNDNKPGLNPDQAREQVRRMLYFLYDFPNEDVSFLKQFLNSSTILRWQEWQSPKVRLEMSERNVLELRIFHVLQEHFTGVRLPEGVTEHDRRLYITLSRGRKGFRQSAQVVLAQIDWSNETALELTRSKNASGRARTDLELKGRGRIHGSNLVLTLPFLDYVVMRHYGEVGEILQPAYVERLERFKTQVIQHAKENRSDVMLVRLKTDHTFRRQQYAVLDGILEVNDVL
ncbi:MAG: hypothetical protein EHM85_03405 [Desulfobacteraceae bacterium]|nr:MAG: hypothetical protein EHM85_03405 [Desulfobacteraceae bacterium]